MMLKNKRYIQQIRNSQKFRFGKHFVKSGAGGNCIVGESNSFKPVFILIPDKKQTTFAVYFPQYFVVVLVIRQDSSVLRPVLQNILANPSPLFIRNQYEVISYSLVVVFLKQHQTVQGTFADG